MFAAARFANKTKRHSLSTEQRKSAKSQDSQKQSLSSRRPSSVISRNNLSTPNSPNVTNNIHLTVPTFHKSRSGSVPNLRYSSANEWGLKPEQALALKVTWTKLCESPHSSCRGIGAIMDQVFSRLNEKNKILREIFYNAAFVGGMSQCRSGRTIATLHDHSQFFISLISQIIQSFDTRSDDIFDHINKIGSNHSGLKKYGFRQLLWDRLGEELIDVLVVQDCVRSFPDACRAWTILIATLIDHLRAAAARSFTSTTTAPIHRRWSCLNDHLSRANSSSSSSRQQSNEEKINKFRSQSSMPMAISSRNIDVTERS